MEEKNFKVTNEKITYKKGDGNTETVENPWLDFYEKHPEPPYVLDCDKEALAHYFPDQLEKWEKKYKKVKEVQKGARAGRLPIQRLEGEFDRTDFHFESGVCPYWGSFEESKLFILVKS